MQVILLCRLHQLLVGFPLQSLQRRFILLFTSKISLSSFFDSVFFTLVFSILNIMISSCFLDINQGNASTFTSHHHIVILSSGFCASLYLLLFYPSGIFSLCHINNWWPEKVVRSEFKAVRSHVSLQWFCFTTFGEYTSVY